MFSLADALRYLRCLLLKPFLRGASDRRALASVLSVRSVVNSYFGAREATISSKRGSPRSGSHHGISFNSP